MIRYMRENLNSIIFQGVLLLAIAAFVGTIFLVWGMGGDTAGRKEPSIATIYEKDIPYRKFADNYRKTYRDYQNAYGDKFNEEVANQLNLKKLTLDQLINTELLLQKARELKFIA